MNLNIETAKIITISIQHLHPDTISLLEQKKGDLEEGPSIAVREEGFLVNSHLGNDDPIGLDTTPGLFPSLHDRFPDLTLIRALARGLKAEWINFDVDGVVCSDILPSYDEQEVDLPSDPTWREALSETRHTPSGVPVVYPSVEVLEMLEAGQTPSVRSETEAPGM